MFALVASAEAVFALPFVIARLFRPTMLEVFGITNTQLGVAFSLYGVVAMVSYFPGGPLADRFSARLMMTVALITTALGGFYFATIPAIDQLTLLFGFWGLTTVLLFWAALIRATREWGGSSSQGTAYGILDGGRGLFAALLATISVAIFAYLLPEDAASATLEQKTDALRQVIWGFTGLVLAAGVLAWVAIPGASSGADTAGGSEPEHSVDVKKIGQVLRMPVIWLNGLIIICAYANFKGSDDFALFASDVFNFDDVKAASVTTITFWVRPFAALGAGLLGDRLGSSRVILLSFAALIVGNSIVAAGLLDPGLPWMLFTAVSGVSVAVYGLRGVYFALLEEGRVPLAVTGTAVGVVSVLGYTPDIFMGPLMGHLTDTYPGAAGHQYLFGVLALFSVLGFAASAGFMAVTKNNNKG
jgi:sugar phosphate permease